MKKAKITIEIDGDIRFGLHWENEITSWSNVQDAKQQQIVIDNESSIITLTIQKHSA